MYNTVLTAIASKLAASIPTSPVYVDEIPQEADGTTFVRIVEDLRSSVGDRNRYAFSVEVLYFQAEHDACTYGEWIEGAFSALKSIEICGKTVLTKNRSARQDTDNRFYQLLLDVEFTLMKITQSDLMETLETNISEEKYV